MKLIASIIALASANYNSHTLPQDVSEFTWADEANRDLFLAQEYVKEYVRYQAPDDEYVPIEDLPIVFLNGIKFRRQGKEPKPDSLERFKKVTRSDNGHLTCMDNDKIHKKHGKGQKEESFKNQPAAEMQMDFVEPLQEIIYPRYNGPDAPFPDAHMGLFEEPEEAEEEEEEEVTPRRTPIQEFNLADVDPVSGGVVSSEFEEPEEDEATMVQLVGEIPEELLAPANFEEESMTREEIRLIRLRKKFFEMKNVKIGCCNGQAYNSQKRCCCRRVSFDMDKKFCCAINGCESFKIMNRGSIQDYNDCLSLDGLVVQEYGYQGQRGQPKIFGGRG
jgi:hypothetical protein